MKGTQRRRGGGFGGGGQNDKERIDNKRSCMSRLKEDEQRLKRY